LTKDKKKFLRLLAINAFVWISAAFYMPFIGVFYAQQGISSFQIGVLMAIGPIMAVSIQPQWAKLSDKTGKRRNVLIMLSLLSAIATIFYIPAQGFYGYVIVTLLVTSFNTSLLPLSDAVVVDLAEKDNINFAHIRMGGTIGFAITVLGVGRHLKQFPLLIFILGSLSYLVFALICRMLPKDIPSHPKQLKMDDRDGVKSNKIFKSNKIIFVLIFALIIQFAVSFNTTFIGVYLLELNHHQTYIGIASAIAALSEIPVLIYIKRLYLRFGAFKLLVFSVVMMVIKLIMTASGILPIIIAAQLLHGISFMTCYYSCIMYISENVLGGNISKAQSRLAMVQAGIGSVGGSVIGGVLISQFNVKYAFVFISGIIFILLMLNIIGLVIYNKKTIKKKITYI